MRGKTTKNNPMILIHVFIKCLLDNISQINIYLSVCIIEY